jgi:hypothetical protein
VAPAIVIDARRPRSHVNVSFMQQEATPLASPAASARDLQRRASTWLIISLVSTLLCLSLALGTGGAIFCYLASQSASQGLTADAEAKLKWGQILTVVGSALGVLTAVLTLIFRK